MRAHLARMQEHGYIRNSEVGSSTALGLVCNAIVMLKVPMQLVNAAARRLDELSRVRFVGLTLGSSDVSIQNPCGKFEEFNRFVSEEILEMVPDVQCTETLQFAEVIKNELNWAEWSPEGLIPLQPAEARVRYGERV